MKKRIAILVVLALVTVSAFAACGNSPEPSGEAGSASVAEASSEAVAEAQSGGSSEAEPVEQSQEAGEADGEEAGDSDISVYAAAMQDMVDALGELYGDSIKIEITTEGSNTLIVTYTLLNDSLGITADDIKENMETQGHTMESLASQMESGGIESPVIVVKWIGIDGSEIFNQEYK